MSMASVTAAGASLLCTLVAVPHFTSPAPPPCLLCVLPGWQIPLQFRLVAAPALGAFHVPPVCTSGALHSVWPPLLPADCVDPGCDMGHCVYRLFLSSQAPVPTRCD